MKNSYRDWFNVYYGQNREDLILRSFFPDTSNGFYVDVGAQDPERFSVTKLFYDQGWRGINIEPQEKFYKQLVKKRPEDINLQQVVGRESGTLKFREYKDATGLSTVSDAMKAEYEGEDKRLSSVTEHYRDYEVKALPLKDILGMYAKNKTIHFLKIDVEGFEKEVIEGNDWSRYRPRVLCIESNHVKDDWTGILEKNSYREFMFDGLNRYYIAEEVYDDLSSSFDYAATALGRVPVNSIPFNLLTRDLRRYSRELVKLNDIVKRQDELIKLQQAKLDRGGGVGKEFSRIKKLQDYIQNKYNRNDKGK